MQYTSTRLLVSREFADERECTCTRARRSNRSFLNFDLSRDVDLISDQKIELIPSSLPTVVLTHMVKRVCMNVAKGSPTPFRV